MSLLEDGANLRKDLRDDFGGQSILYQRGSTLSAAITARPGVVEREAIGSESVVYIHGTDFVFARSDALWAETAESFVPQPGDIITFASKDYEVSALGGGQCYSESDHLDISVRVHAVEI